LLQASVTTVFQVGDARLAQPSASQRRDGLANNQGVSATGRQNEMELATGHEGDFSP